MGNAAHNVRAFYDGDPEREWIRLERHPCEFTVTMRYLTRYLCEASCVLDVGGGPGRYALELASMGHGVTLFDLSEGNIALARKKAEDRGISLPDFHVGDATDLSAYGDATFDAVLCMGPMYHLTEEHQRSQAMQECLRVLKPGGLLAVAFISSHAPILDALNKDPNWIHEMRPAFLDCARSHVRSSSEGDAFTDAFYMAPGEVRPFVSSFGIDVRAVIGAEGPLSQSESAIDRCGPATHRAWIDLAIDLAETDIALSCSIHLVCFGRKSGVQEAGELSSA